MVLMELLVVDRTVLLFREQSVRGGMHVAALSWFEGSSLRAYGKGLPELIASAT